MKITLLKSLFLLGAFICFSGLQAQTVSGTVSDASGPLPGASVLVKGTTNGTQTDFDGNYTLSNVADGATLVFSYIGYSTKEIAVNGQSSINVTLSEDAQALDEVVIIGYGSTTVKDATGSVTAVTSEDFNGGVIASPEQLIQGKTAGVNIQQSSGEPGAGISVNIRGSNSVRANNNPLFVIDGVPLGDGSTDAEGNAGTGGTTSVRNPLNFLNPSDIESISVLKDASATAIYGSRGANGVVIITTKTGKAAQGGVFEFTSNLSVSTPANSYDLLNRDQFLEAIALYGNDPAASDFGSNTNWQDYVTRTAASTNQNLSYSQNYGSGNVRATFGYSKQFGIVEKTDLERISGRINWRQRLFDDKLTIGLSSTISRVNNETAPLQGTAGFQGDILGAAYSANPTWPADPSFSFSGLLNPANYLENFQNRTNTNRFLINGSLEYQFNSELTGKINLGYDKSDSQNISVTSGNVVGIQGAEGIGFGTLNTLERTNKLLEATVNYKKEFDNINVDALVGYSFQDFQNNGLNSQGRGFSTTDLNGMGQALEQTVFSAKNVISGSYQQYYYDSDVTGLIVNRLLPDVVAGESITGSFDRNVTGLAVDTFDFTDELQSFFGRLNIGFNSKYLFTATVRADGSSRFGPENQYGIFPSGAFAWQIGEEDFVGENISTLKLRLSAGVTGNQAGLGYGNFVARQRFAGFANGWGVTNDAQVNQNGTVIVATDVPDLKWEPTLNLNVGLDFGFNSDRFNGSLDIYRNTTSDILLQAPPAAPSNSPFQFGNVDAEIVNQGVELALSYDWVQSDKATFSTSFNIAYNNNEIQNFDGIIDSGPINGQGLTGAFAQRFASGQSLFSFYMAEFTGLDSAGQPTYADVNGDGVGDVFQDKKFVGEDGLPDVTAGLSLNLNVGNWDVATYFAGQFGFSVYNNTANGLFTSGSITNSRNVTTNLLTSGDAPGASADVSTRFLEKGDFVRLQNASIGYNVPLSGEGALKSLRLSLTGQNLFLITDYSGLDPEVTVNTGTIGLSALPSRSIDWTSFPNPRTVTFGINASF